MKGYLMQMQPFSVNDGDGIRTTIFLAGCPLHCKWCANPEGLRQHPVVGFYARLCIGCGACRKICAHDAPTIENRKMHIDTNKCVGCGRCIAVCPMDAIEGVYDPNGHLLNCKMAEYAKAVVQGRPSFHISLAMDISPNCDCHAENDVPVIPNVGMFASFDPVALDEACAEMCSRMPRNPNAAFEDASSDAVAEHAKIKQRLAAAEEEWFALTEELEEEMARQAEQL